MSDLEKAEAINPELILADDDELHAPDVGRIMALHRHTDGYVSFSIGTEDGLRPHIAIRADELETYFPEFQQRFLKDAYVGINAGYKTRNRQDRGKPKGYPLHRTENLRYLCACYVDLDYYKSGASFYETVVGVLWAQDNQVIPHASIIVRSGRGMWLLWFLRDPDNPDQAAKAFPEKRDLYGQINRAIGQKLKGLGADPAANDAARHIRIPGSLHTGHTAGSGYVEWLVQKSSRNPDGYVYTLDELAAFFHVEPRKLHPKSREAFDEDKKPKTERRRGWQALNSYRLRDFETLQSLRGGFIRGTRNNAAKIYAWLLKNEGLKRDEVERELYLFACACHPSLAPSEVKAAASFVFKQGGMRKMLHQTIADWLNITPEESASLERLPSASLFEAAAPKPKPKPKRSAAAAPAPPTAADREQRLQAILALVEELGGVVPSNRDLAARLTERGFPVSHVSVIKDCEKLGLKSPQTAKKQRQRENVKRQGTLDIS